jgi:hypothetical protein
VVGFKIVNQLWGFSLVDGGYSVWSEWMDCSLTCGGGLSTRRRSCTFPEPQFRGKDCLSTIGPDTESKACKTDKCPGRLKI